MKRIVPLALVFMLLFTNLCFVHADGPAVRSRDCFHGYGVTLGDAGGGVLAITFHCVGRGVCSQLGVASYCVEMQDDDGDWQNVSGLLDGETGSNAASFTYGRCFRGCPAGTYRVSVTFICMLNGRSEIGIHTSAVITLD